MKKRFEAITIMHRTHKDKYTQVWATIENGKITAISEPSGKLLARKGENIVIYKDEEYFFYHDLK